jgi:cerevisin
MKLSANFAVLLASISVTIASPIYDATVVNKDSAPLLSSASAADHEIPNNYIVVFKKDVGDEVASAHHSWVADIHEASVASLRKRSQVPLMEHSNNVDVLDVDSLTGLKHTYNISGGLTGYSGAFDDSVLEEIRKHPAVSSHLLSPHCPGYPGACLAGVSYVQPERVHVIASLSAGSPPHIYNPANVLYL